jgi:alpha-D-xyloside xylohydrolase
MPYIYSQSWKVTSEGYTLMRALPLDFSDDIKARDISDAFMFGPAFLVHPVTRAMYQTDNPPAQTLPTEFLQTPEGQPGLSVQYFAGVNFDTPKEKGIDKIIDHDWPGPPLAVPPGGLDSCENFSSRWEGIITAPEDGEYEIGIEGDDGFRLFLDGKRVISDWNSGAKRYKNAKITFSKGQKVAVKLEFYQGAQERALRLGWRTPSDIIKMKGEKKVLDSVVETYLPAGASWYDFWTNTKLEGGQTAKKECPLNILPLYVRAGSIVPMGPVMQYATEKPDAPYEIRIYPGADAKFTIYEDDNETYNYEKGQYAACDLTWNDAAQTLTIGSRKGKFPGMVEKRTFKIVKVQPGRGAGIALTETVDKEIQYDGNAVTISLTGQTQDTSATVSGTWKADIDTQIGVQKYTFSLKQEGNSISGKAQVDIEGEQFESQLSGGKLDGDTISFNESLDFQRMQLDIRYTGKVNGNEIKMTRQVGEFATEEFVARRDQ